MDGDYPEFTYYRFSTVINEILPLISTCCCYAVVPPDQGLSYSPLSYRWVRRHIFFCSPGTVLPKDLDAEAENIAGERVPVAALMSIALPSRSCDDPHLLYLTALLFHEPVAPPPPLKDPWTSQSFVPAVVADALPDAVLRFLDSEGLVFKSSYVLVPGYEPYALAKVNALVETAVDMALSSSRSPSTGRCSEYPTARSMDPGQRHAFSSQARLTLPVPSVHDCNDSHDQGSLQAACPGSGASANTDQPRLSPRSRSPSRISPVPIAGRPQSMPAPARPAIPRLALDVLGAERGRPTAPIPHTPSSSRVTATEGVDLYEAATAAVHEVLWVFVHSKIIDRWEQLHAASDGAVLFALYKLSGLSLLELGVPADVAGVIDVSCLESVLPTAVSKTSFGSNSSHLQRSVAESVLALRGVCDSKVTASVVSKLRLLSSVIEALVESVPSSMRSSVSADSILPLTLFALTRAGCPKAASTLHYLRDFVPPAFEGGLASYCLATLEAGITAALSESRALPRRKPLRSRSFYLRLKRDKQDRVESKRQASNRRVCPPTPSTGRSTAQNSENPSVPRSTVRVRFGVATRGSLLAAVANAPIISRPGTSTCGECTVGSPVPGADRSRLTSPAVDSAPCTQRLSCNSPSVAEVAEKSCSPKRSTLLSPHDQSKSTLSRSSLDALCSSSISVRETVDSAFGELPPCPRSLTPPPTLEATDSLHDPDGAAEPWSASTSASDSEVSSEFPLLGTNNPDNGTPIDRKRSPARRFTLADFEKRLPHALCDQEQQQQQESVL